MESSDTGAGAPRGAEEFAAELDRAERSPAIPEHPVAAAEVDDAGTAPVKDDDGHRMTH